MDEAPIRGAWYETETGLVFVVERVDAASGRIDVQYLDDTVDELDRAIWKDHRLTEIDRAVAWSETIDDYFREH